MSLSNLDSIPEKGGSLRSKAKTMHKIGLGRSNTLSNKRDRTSLRGNVGQASKFMCVNCGSSENIKPIDQASNEHMANSSPGYVQ